jgi:hypothetical protein
LRLADGTDAAPWVRMKSRVLLITWLLALVLALYLVENLWLDAWLRVKFPNWPALVPESLTPLWFVLFSLGGIVCVVLIVCQVLVSRHRRIALWQKVCTGIMVAAVCVLWGAWFNSSNGTTSAAGGAGQNKHAVTLTWNASSSPVVGYNVYRSTVKGRDYAKINAALVTEGLSYKDETVESGKTYYYVTRAVDAKGNESKNSTEVVAKVP